ncbi:MAG: hypothetical protein K6G52_08460 [Treponemataceae bacterium]|nr:hypothetical protein [Treponemataceae bacterium]
MATVRMKKGDKYADIFDSPETIKQAQFEGYSLCEEKKPTADVEVKTKVEESSKENTSEKKQKTARQ